MTADTAEMALIAKLDAAGDELISDVEKIRSGQSTEPAPAPTPPVEAAPAPAPETPSEPVAPVAATPEPPKAEVAAPTAEERKAYTDFLAKHGGDPEKGSQHYFEVMRQNADFKRQLDEAKAAKAAPPAEPVSPPPAEVPPLVKELDQRILALSTEFNQVEEHLKQAQAVKPQWTEHRENLLQKFFHTTDADEAAKIRADLEVAKTALDRIDAVERAASSRRAQLITDYNSVEFNKKIALQLHEARQASTQLASTSEERQVAEERKAFSSAIDKVITAKGIPEADREDFKEEARLRANHKVNNLDEEIADYEAFASEVADRYLARQRRVAAEYATAKKVDSKPAAPTGPAAVAPAPTKRPAATTLNELSQSLDDRWAQENV